MKTVHLDSSKLLGFHAVRPAGTVEKPGKTSAAKSAAKIGTKLGVKPV